MKNLIFHTLLGTEFVRSQWEMKSFPWAVISVCAVAFGISTMLVVVRTMEKRIMGTLYICCAS